MSSRGWKHWVAITTVSQLYPSILSVKWKHHPQFPGLEVVVFFHYCFSIWFSFWQTNFFLPCFYSQLWIPTQCKTPFFFLPCPFLLDKPGPSLLHTGSLIYQVLIISLFLCTTLDRNRDSNFSLGFWKFTWSHMGPNMKELNSRVKILFVSVDSQKYRTGRDFGFGKFWKLFYGFFFHVTIIILPGNYWQTLNLSFSPCPSNYSLNTFPSSSQLPLQDGFGRTESEKSELYLPTQIM